MPIIQRQKLIFVLISGALLHSRGVNAADADFRLVRAWKANSTFTRSVAISPDGTHVACASKDEVQVWSIGNAKRVARLLDGPPSGKCVTYLDNGNLIATAKDRSLDRGSVVWSTANYVPLYHLPTSLSTVSSYIAPRGRVIAVGSTRRWSNLKIFMEKGMEYRTDGSIELWDAQDLKRFPFKGSGGLLELAASYRNRGRISDFTQSTSSLAFGAKRIYAGSWLPFTKKVENGKLRAAELPCGILTSWSLSNGRMSWQSKKLSYPIERLEMAHKHLIAFGGSASWPWRHGGDPTVSMSGRGTVSVWSIRPHSCEQLRQASFASVSDIASLPKTKQLLTVAVDGIVRLVHIDSLKVLGIIARLDTPITCVTVSVNGQQFAIGTANGTVAVWKRK